MKESTKAVSIVGLIAIFFGFMAQFITGRESDLLLLGGGCLIYSFVMILRN